jgi:hypothetical protein
MWLVAKSQPHMPTSNGESRLEGGVDRRKLKFINLNHNYKLGLALEINLSPKERGNKSTKEMERMTR